MLHTRRHCRPESVLVALVALAVVAGCGAPDYEITRERPNVVVDVSAGLDDQEALDVIKDVRTNPQYDDRRVSLRCPSGLERAASPSESEPARSIADC